MKNIILLFFLVFLTMVVKGNDTINYRLGNRDGGGVRIVLETPFEPKYSYMYLDNRIVINIQSSKDYKLKGSTSNLSYIKNVRYGKLTNVNRIVLDTASDAVIEKHFVLNPDKENKEYRIVLDTLPKNKLLKDGKEEIKLPSPIVFSEEKEKKIEEKEKKIEEKEEKLKPIFTHDKEIKKQDKKIIVIDAGHGGKDPGAIGKSGSYEKNITLSTAKYLEDELEKKGFKVYLTRRSDVFIPLQDRSEYAKKKKADLFISIHADSHPKSGTKGLSIYTLSDKATDQESARLAERENAADLMDLSLSKKYNKNVVSLLSDLKLKQTKEESTIFSKLLLQEVKRDSKIDLLDDRQRSAPFAVLKSHIPSVLIELGYMSNKDEEKLLKSSSYQKRLAEKISKSISKYPFIND